MTINKTLCAALAAALVLAGCAGMSETQRGTAIGAGVGAAAGAVLGRATGNTGAGAAIGTAAGALGGYIWSNRMEQQKRAMEQATQGTGVAVTQTPDNQLKLEVPSDVSFDTGRADIKANFRPVLDRFGQTLREHPQTTVRIVGHTDSTGSDAVNDPLSLRRAQTVRDYLDSRGVPGARMSIEGRGAREPLADNGTEAGRARNRRVEILLREPQA